MNIDKPIVVDLGKARRKHVKALRTSGDGKLAREVAETLEHVKANLGAGAEGKQLVPVVVFYRKKSKRGFGLGG